MSQVLCFWPESNPVDNFEQVLTYASCWLTLLWHLCCFPSLSPKSSGAEACSCSASFACFKPMIGFLFHVPESVFVVHPVQRIQVCEKLNKVQSRSYKQESLRTVWNSDDQVACLCHYMGLIFITILHNCIATNCQARALTFHLGYCMTSSHQQFHSHLGSKSYQ